MATDTNRPEGLLPGILVLTISDAVDIGLVTLD